MPATADELLAMLTFVRVVDGRSFTAAAATLGVAKSVVSSRVAALESQLKVRLLHRTTRKLSLTPDGLALYQRCVPVVAAADAASLAVAGTGDTPRGVLRVNAPVAFAEEYLAAPVAVYLAAHPDVRIDIAVNDRIVDLVDERVDVALRVASRLGGGTGLVARKLASDRTVLVASPGYLTRRGTPSAPDQLLGHDCLAYSLLKVSDEWRFRVPTTRAGARAAGGDATVSVPIEPRFTAASGALLRRAALADMGVAVLPSFMVAADVAAGRLRRIAVETFVGATLGVHAIYPRARPVSAKTRTFIDVLVAHFRTPRW